MTWTAVVTVVVCLVALAVAVTGFNLITGRWAIPTDKQEKVAIGALVGVILLGILSVLMCLHPRWSAALSRPLRPAKQA